MFKFTVVASKLREQMASYLEQVKGSDVLQILHRGDSIKVMMTQEHYLNILSRLAVYEKGQSETALEHKPSSVIRKVLEEKLKQLQNEEDTERDQSNVGQKRSRTA